MDKNKLLNAAKAAAEKTATLAKAAGQKTVEVAKSAEGKTIEVAKKVGGKTKELAVKSKDAAMDVMDYNGDGKVDIEDIIILGLKTPGVRINREKFLRKEFEKKYSPEIIDEIVKYNPAHAKITPEECDAISDEVIKYERNCVSGISAALGTPGGAAMAATIPADIIQYYGYILRVMQKLMYLYGFPEIDLEEKEQIFDSVTLNSLIICLGTMYAVAGANNALKVMAKGLATGVEKQLMQKALTKGTIYPIVKSVSKWFGVRMTKEVFAGFFKKAIPVVGGVIGGGITFFSFKPCCDRFKAVVRDTYLSNPDHVESKEEQDILEGKWEEVEETDESINEGLEKEE